LNNRIAIGTFLLTVKIRVRIVYPKRTVASRTDNFVDMFFCHSFFRLINSSLPALGFIELYAVEKSLISKNDLKYSRYSSFVPPYGG
jgi:hypothetical protein